MKKIIIFLTILWGFSSCFGQVSIWTNKDSCTVAWEKVNTNINGEPEDSVYYDVFIAKMVDFTILRNYITADTLQTFNIKNYPEGFYLFGVYAIDKVGNRSETLWSDDCVNNAAGCWYMGFDIVPPVMPKRIKSK